MEIKNVLITGSEGYIGSVLVPKLIQKDFLVTGLDAGFYEDSLFESQPENYHLISADIRDINTINLEEYDAIIHLAALSNDPLSELSPELTTQINEDATINFAQKAKWQGVKRFIFSSSCSIYGIAKEETVTEKSEVNPLTAYAKSKIAVEQELQKLSDNSFTVGIMRNSTVYGSSPKYRNDLVVNNLVSSAVALNEIRIMSDGTPWRPLIDARDLADIFIEFLLAESKVINGKIFNIGFEENNVQVKEIAELVKKVLPSCKIIYTGEHGADSRSYKVSFETFKKAFPNIKQKWTLSKSIKNLVDILKTTGFSKEDFKNGKYIRIKELKERNLF